MLLLAAAVMMMLTACKDKKQTNENIITTDYEIPKPSEAPVVMGATTDRADAEWVEGRHYTVTVTREAADSLPKVTDEIGQKYVDNIVRVKVMRADSTVFFNRSFTKSAFVGWLDSDYRKNALLEGIRFLKADGDSLVFVAWLNYPQSGDDEAVELLLTIGRNAEVNIQNYSENDRDDLEQMDQEEEP